jgi:hypothetical protein
MILKSLRRLWEDGSMTPIDRPLTEAESHYMRLLAIRVISDQTGGDVQASVEALEMFAAEGKVRIRGDAENAFLDVDDQTIVRVTRDWLAFHAHHDDGHDPMESATPV